MLREASARRGVTFVDAPLSRTPVEAEAGRLNVMVGADPIIEGTLTAIFAGGHVLLEGVPGLGKTLLVRTLSEVLELSFNPPWTPERMSPAGREQLGWQAGPP